MSKVFNNMSNTQLPQRAVVREMGDAPIRASEVHVSCGLLYDLVFLAGGAASKLSPLCNETAKPLLPIGNRPLIVHAVRPWVDKGARTIFICAPDYDILAVEKALKEEFDKAVPNLLFVFVAAPAFHGGQDDDDSVSIPTVSGDALVKFYEKKQELKGTPEGIPRDVLVVSGDTILAKVDIEPFINNFYSSYASVNVLLWRPKQVDKSAAAAATKSGGKAGKAPQRFPDKKSWQHEYSCVAYEETLPNALASSNTLDGASEALVEHHRLHYIQSSSDAAPTISVGFAARRPHLTFCADVTDAHVYLLRQWVVEFIVADRKKEQPVLDGASLRLDVIPLLARSQHALVHSEEKKFVTPLERLMTSAVSAEWATDLSSPQAIGSLSSVRMSTNPTAPVLAGADALRVTCTIYQEPASIAENRHAIRRVNTRDNYLAIHHEILQTLPPPGMLTVAEDVTAMGLVCLEVFAKEHDDVISKVNPSFTTHVTQSLIRSPPTNNSTFITRSIVGLRVQMGVNVRIVNSVIGDNVELQDNATVVNSVLGVGAGVMAGVRIASCFAPAGVFVAKDASDIVVTAEDD